MPPALGASLLGPEHPWDPTGTDWRPSVEVSLRKLIARRPFCFLRVGDSEIVAALDWVPPDFDFRRRRYEQIGGFDATFPTHELREAFRRCTALGVNNFNRRWREATRVLLAALDVPERAPHLVDFHLAYGMLVTGELSRLVADRRVVLVGERAEEVAGVLARKGTPPFAGAFAAASVRAVATRRPLHRTFNDAIERVCAEPVDLVLVGAGTPGKVLGHRLWQRGIDVLDVGFVFDALLGHPKRTCRRVLRDAPWLTT